MNTFSRWTAICIAAGISLCLTACVPGMENQFTGTSDPNDPNAAAQDAPGVVTNDVTVLQLRQGPQGVPGVPGEPGADGAPGPIGPSYFTELPQIGITYTGGALGVGTPTPAALLHVGGNARIDGDLSFTLPGSGIIFPDGTKLSSGNTLVGWSLAGNAGTDPNVAFLGTTDDVPFTVRVNNFPAVRYQYFPSSQPIDEGSGIIVNDGFIEPNAQGGVIAGGLHHLIAGNFCVIAGGKSNTITAKSGLLTDAEFSTIGGGFSHLVGSTGTTIAGGITNVAIGPCSTVAGGSNNTTSGFAAFVAGGDGNRASGDFSAIGGGNLNQANADGAVIAGGRNNSAGQLGAIGGGTFNITGATAATIAGGQSNRAEAPHAVVGGGFMNGVFGTASVVAGGSSNVVEINVQQGAIGGGFNNRIEPPLGQPLNLPDRATIAGGLDNRVQSTGSFIGGGNANLIGTLDPNDPTDTRFSAIAGGQSNQILNTLATIGGGQFNRSNGQGSVVGGGVNNFATNQFSTIAGGTGNAAVAPFSTVGGGESNQATGLHSTVPGGALNEAKGQFTFAAGRRAKVSSAGAFVFGDSTDADVTDFGPDTFSVRSSGGARFYSDAALESGVELPAGGGAWQSLSDRNMKENVRAVNAREVLAKVVAMPVTTWNYITQEDGIRHMGPMAQDFYAAFGLGESDKRITTIDIDGVALAAIKGLYELVRERDAEVAALRDESTRQRREIEALNARLERVEAALLQASERR